MIQDLRNIVSRLSTLTASSSQQSTPLNFAVGAMFALMKAEQLGYLSLKRVDERGLRMWRKARGICLDIVRGGELPMQGEWLAGYFFNDGIIRIAVAFEHIVRHATNLHGHERFKKMKKYALQAGFKDEWAASWKAVHEEVNRLKHQNLRFVDGPVLNYDKAIEALDHLVFALKWGTRPRKGIR